MVRAAIGAVAMALALAALAAPGVASAGTTDAATQSVTTIRYGPFFIPGGAGHDDPGMIENLILPAVAKPCVGCYITQIAPRLVYPDGTSANINTGAMLHHTVLASAIRQDAV